jgi:hypothetical protein
MRNPSCGPYWSAGKLQTSVCSTLPPVDKLDSVCKQHDCDYASGVDYQVADEKFIEATKDFPDLYSKLFRAAIRIQHSLRMPPKNTKRNPTPTPGSKKAKTPTMRLTSSTPTMRQTVAELSQLLTDTQIAPAAIGRRVSMAKPSYRTLQNGNTIVKHCEFVSVVASSATFACNRTPINPGLPIFPWLQSLAANYDRYKWRKLSFYYVPAVASSQAGRMCLAFSKDANQSTPINNQQMFSIVPNNEETLWQEISINVPCDNKEYYVRTFGTSQFLQAGTNNNTTDLKTTDMGVLFQSSNYNGLANVGELYCAYEIELLDPSISSNPFSGEISSTTSTVTNLFNAPVLLSGNVVANTVFPSNFAFLASGSYMVSLSFLGTVIGAAPSLSTTTGTITVTSIIAWTVNAAALFGTGTWLFVVTADNSSGVALCSIVPNATTVTSVKVCVAQVQPSSLT